MGHTVDSPIRVVVVDDLGQDRSLQLTALALASGVVLVPKVGDLVRLLRVLETHRPDVILVALGLGILPAGLTVLRRLHARREHPPVVVMVEENDTRQVDQALSLGAVGIVVATSPVDEVVVALRWAAAGGAYLQPKVARAMLARRFGQAAPPNRPTPLSRRQLDLLRELALGLTNKEIAHRLDLAPGTVNDYMKQLFQRLGVETRAAAVGTGMRQGLIG